MYLCTDSTQTWTRDIKTLIRSQLDIPGLHLIGHADLQNADTNLGTHYHHMMEIVVTLDGKLQFIVDGLNHILYGGDMFMASPMEAHGNEGLPLNVCEYVWFQFDLSVPPEQFLALPPKQAVYVYLQLTQYHHRIKRAHSKDLPLLREAF